MCIYIYLTKLFTKEFFEQIDRFYPILSFDKKFIEVDEVKFSVESGCQSRLTLFPAGPGGPIGPASPAGPFSPGGPGSPVPGL